MYLEKNLQEHCLKRIEDCYVKAEKHYGVKLGRPAITFSNRLTSTAGKAFYCRLEGGRLGSKEIRLSNKLLKLNQAEFIKDTPGHEAAHLIAGSIYGAKAMGHSVHWEEVMKLLGQEAVEFHRMETPKARAFEYININGVVKTLTIRRHNRLQRKQAEYYEWPDGIRMYRDNFTRELPR